MSAVQADLRDDGVSAADVPTSAGLQQVVADAKQKGIDLKIVVISTRTRRSTPRCATSPPRSARRYPGSTVLVLSPSFAGTYSPTFDRVTLEAGQDIAKTAAIRCCPSKNFVSELTTPHFPWTPFTIVLVLGVAVAAVATRILQVRAQTRGRAKSPATADN